MSGIFSVFVSAFLFLIGLYLPLPATPDDPEMDEAAKHKALAKRARYAVTRLVLQVGAALILVIHFIFGLGKIHDTGALLLLLACYTSFFLLIQRSERNRQLATLVFMAFCGWLVWKYAQFRDHKNEAQWAIYLALLINYLFWQFIGQRFPVGSSKDIQVWGMDEGMQG